ncbi:MAG TPA: hypothetical protein VM262_05630 [Acidimicrobiales bacterium]|nr:hypothetical protein [Acidimicrobiales bacterium]
MSARPVGEEFVVTVQSRPDGAGKQRFVAEWLDPAVPGGVRGQVFHTALDDFVARRSSPVRIIDETGAS